MYYESQFFFASPNSPRQNSDMDKPSTAIEMKNVTKRYGDVVALKDLSWEIFSGEGFGLLGPNGAGKSTSMRLMYGAANLDMGEIYVLGLNVKQNIQRIKKRIGVVPQEDGLDQEFSVLENLIMYASYFGIKSKEAEDRAKKQAEEAAQKAINDAKAAEEKARKDLIDAQERERIYKENEEKRIEQEAKTKASMEAYNAEVKRKEEADRAADEVHKKKILNEVYVSLTKHGMNHTDAELLIAAICRNEIQNVTINY